MDVENQPHELKQRSNTTYNIQTHPQYANLVRERTTYAMALLFVVGLSLIWQFSHILWIRCGSPEVHSSCNYGLQHHNSLYCRIGCTKLGQNAYMFNIEHLVIICTWLGFILWIRKYIVSSQFKSLQQRQISLSFCYYHKGWVVFYRNLIAECY